MPEISIRREHDFSANNVHCARLHYVLSKQIYEVQNNRFSLKKLFREYVFAKYGRSLLVDFNADFFLVLSYEVAYFIIFSHNGSQQPLFGREWANNAAVIGFISFGGLSVATIIVRRFTVVDFRPSSQISGIGMYRFTNGKLCSEKMRKLNQRLLGTLAIQVIKTIGEHKQFFRQCSPCCLSTCRA